jgi:hypothetical protein
VRTDANDRVLAGRQGPVLYAPQDMKRALPKSEDIISRFFDLIPFQLLVACIVRSEVAQDHLGRPIVVCCIPTIPWLIALRRDARPQCLMTTRARFLLAGMTVSVMVRNLGRERR